MKWLPLVALVAFAPTLALGQTPGRGQAFTVPVVDENQGVAGTFQITQFYQAGGQLWGSGLFTGTVNGVHTSTPGRVLIDEEAISAGLTQGLGGAGVITQQQVSCDILTLNLGPLHLDLLGLVIDLSAIDLEITAVPGAGNLLGNLLCAVAGLLDPDLGPITNLLEQLVALLNSILDILN